MDSILLKRSRNLPYDLQLHILSFLTDEYEVIHKQRFAPTLHILNRFHIECGICRRRNQQEYLCGRCLGQLRNRLQAYLPGQLFTHGPNLVFPVPWQISVDKLVHWLTFTFAQLHVAFDWCSSSLPILHLEDSERTLFVPGYVLILRPYRRFGFHHFFFRKPAGFLPSWTCEVQEDDDRLKMTVGEPQLFSGIPGYLADPTTDSELRYKYLNSFFPK